MATGIVTFPAAVYAPGSPGPRRAVVTITKWAGDRALVGTEDAFYEIETGADLVVTLDATDGTFCYRVNIQTPAALDDEVRYVSLSPSVVPVLYSALVDVDPTSFVPIDPTPTLIETIENAVAAYLIANPPVGGGGGATDATTLAKGIVKLAGDLAGTADLPTVPGLAGKSALVHTHAQADVTGLVAALALLAPLVHTHAEADVTGLVADLAAKSPLVHAHAQADVTGLVAALALLAPLVSAALTGTPTAPTAAPGTNTTQLATTAFVAALGALKANLASPALTGTPTVPTAAPGTNTTQVASTAFVEAARVILAAADALKSPIASPTFTGVPAGPTAAPGTNTTQLATTAFVEAARVILAAADALKAPIASPTFTGTPTAPTAAPGDNTTKLATTAFVTAANGLLVPKSLVDAKGDLFVGTANDTVARLAVGADGEVLTADAASAGGVKWAAGGGGGGGSKNWMPGLFSLPGFQLQGASMGNGNFAWGATQVYMIPFTITIGGTATGLQVAVNSAGGAGATARVAIYSAGATDTSTHTLLLDAGTVAVDSTGLKTITISQALTAGRYLLAITSSATFGPTYYSFGALVYGIVYHEDYTSRRGLSTTMTYGAFPGTLTPSYMTGYAQPSESNIPVLIKLT